MSDDSFSRDLSPSTEKSSGAVAPRITEAELPSGCACISTVNNMLRKESAELVTTLFGRPNRVVIATTKLDDKRRGKAPSMVGSYCPFCGTRYVAPEDRS